MKALEGDIAKLDTVFNDLTEIMAEGERDDFTKEWLGCTSCQACQTITVGLNRYCLNN